MSGGRRFIAAATTVALAICSACSETSRYRVLSFFLDGVPPPGSKTAAVDALAGSPTPTGGIEHAQPAPPQKIFAHTPYRENRCQGCHDLDSGGLTRSLDDGLCLTCHAPVVAHPFVHGPAAVNACTECHHYHAAPFPKLLLIDSTATCLKCHERDDLGSGEHHADLDAKECGECHDPHGGNNRYFVKGVSP